MEYKNNEQWVALQRALDFLRLRKRAYGLTFQKGMQNEAIKDMAKFAHIGKAAYNKDQRLNDILIGRQEMFFRVVDHLKLSPEELYDLYHKPSSLHITQER